MISRIPLGNGERISSNDRSYTIERVIGEGAFSIVYSAFYNDSMKRIHRVNVKECYPFASDVTRSGSLLTWPAETGREADLEKFRKSYDNLLKIQHDINRTNTTVHVFDLLEANGTLYSVMDYNEGKTFVEDRPDNLKDILTTVLALTKAVGRYHRNGYLHLDIKPENFLVIPETRELVILFDLDTVTSMDDIRSGSVAGYSYSERWAAPEQMQGQYRKFCPATDLYAVGAVLFEKIMGRDVCNDDIGILADWDFDGGLFENVNPAVKRMLRDIYRKTIAANVKRRWQSADELASALEKALWLIREGTPFLLSDLPLPTRNFIGRADELQEIFDSLNHRDHAVFLYGLGGIGKSELAKRYALQHIREYDAVLFLSYRISLMDLVNNLLIQNYDDPDESFEKRLSVLRKIFQTQKTLLIIDNFDVDIDADEELDKILGLNTDLIFTTRTDFGECEYDRVHLLEVKELNDPEKIALFKSESGLKLTSEADIQMIEWIIAESQGHTMVLTLLARQISASGWNLSTLCENLRKGIGEFPEAEKVSLRKDGRVRCLTIPDFLRVIFRMEKLTALQKQVLINLYYLRFMNMNKAQYRKYLSREHDLIRHIDAVNELCRQGWITRTENVTNSADPNLTLHPLVSATIERELEPSIAECESLIECIKWNLPDLSGYGEQIDEQDDSSCMSQLEKDTISQKLAWFFAFLHTMNWNRSENCIFAVDTLFGMINGNVWFFGYFDPLESICKSVFLRMAEYAESFDIESRLKTYSLLEAFWLEKIHYIYLDNEKRDAIDRENRQNFAQYFWKAVRLVSEQSQPFREKAVWIICKPVIYQIRQYSAQGITDDILETVKSYESDWRSIYVEWREDAVFEDDNNDSLYEKFNEYEVRKAASENESAVSIGPKPDKSVADGLYDEFLAGTSVNDLLTKILNNTRGAYVIAKNINDILRYLMFGIDQYMEKGDAGNLQQYILSVDWERADQLNEEGWRFIQNCSEPDNDWKEELLKDFQLRRILIYAIQNGEIHAHIPYQEIIEQLEDDFRNSVQNMGVNIWDRLSTWEKAGYSDIPDNMRQVYYVISYVQYYHKSNRLIPFLKVLIDNLQPIIIDQPEKKQSLASYYGWLSQLAVLAGEEEGEEFKEGREYYELYMSSMEEYRNLTGQDFSGEIEEGILTNMCRGYYSYQLMHSEDYEQLAMYLDNNPIMSTEELITMYADNIAWSIIWRLGHLPYRDTRKTEFLQDTDWHRLAVLMEYEEIAFQRFTKEGNENQIIDSMYEYHMCEELLTVSYVMVNDISSFHQVLQRVFRESKEHYISNWETKTDHILFFSGLDYVSFLPHSRNYCFGDVLEDLVDIHQSCLAIPYLLKAYRFVMPYIRTLDEHTRKPITYEWYTTIADYAKIAVSDTPDPQKAAGYRRLHDYFQAKADEMTGKDYQIITGTNE